MDDYADEMRLRNTLSHEVHVTQTSRGVTKLLVLIARVVVHAVRYKVFVANFL